MPNAGWLVIKRNRLNPDLFVAIDDLYMSLEEAQEVVSGLNTEDQQFGYWDYISIEIHG